MKVLKAHKLAEVTNEYSRVPWMNCWCLKLLERLCSQGWARPHVHPWMGHTNLGRDRREALASETDAWIAKKTRAKLWESYKLLWVVPKCILKCQIQVKPSLISAALGSSSLSPRKGNSLVKMNWKEEFTGWAEKQMLDSRLLSPLQCVPQYFSPTCLKNFAFWAIASCDFSWNNPGWLWLKVILGEPLELIANKIKCAQWFLLQAMSPQPRVSVEKQECATFAANTYQAPNLTCVEL